MVERPTWVGKVLGGRYRIDDILGQGGMSAVYTAFDPNLKRVVAVKIIHGHLADDQRFLMRFEEEAAAVAQLRHPNIVQVFDFNHDGDLYYKVQEFIPGETLQQTLRRLEKAGRRILLPDVIRYTINIAQATGYAHQRGMIHRDIKPANIMIDVHGQATLMDFGIVKIVGAERHTATGAVVGTALYLPPELIRGELPDPRSDIYSLGVTLFEMVSGRPPYEADSAMTLMMMHLNDPIPDLRLLRHGTPPELIAVIEKAMRKSRLERYASMEDMAADLQAVLGGLSAAPQATQVEIPAAHAAPPLPVRPTSDSRTLPEAATPAAVWQPAPAVQPQTIRPQTVQPQPAPAKTASPVQASSPITSGAPKLEDASAPVSQAGGAASAAKKPLPNAVKIGAGLLGLLVVLLLGYQILRGGSPPGGEPTETVSPTTAVAAVMQPSATVTPTETGAPTATATLEPTSTPTLTATPTLGLPPTATFPAGVPFAYIQEITLDTNKRYIVDYDTLTFVEQVPGVHVHFFFDTVLPEQAGHPGTGPWYMWGGPRPFDKYKQSDHSELAAQMCILVANPDHSVQLNTGNCMILPDVNAVTILTDLTCLANPEAGAQVLAELDTGQVAHVMGMSPDEAWWNIADPGRRFDTCWAPAALAYFHGERETVPLVEPEQ